MTDTCEAGTLPRAPRGLSTALISYVVSDEMLDMLVRIDPAPAIQTQRFGQVLLALLDGTVDRLGSYNFAPVQDYPIARKWWFSGGTHRRNGQDLVTLPFINIVLLKHVSRLLSLATRFFRLRRFDTILVHGLHLPNLIFARLLGWAGVRIGVVLTDAQGIVLPGDGRLRRILKGLDRRMAVGLARGFDFAVALSDDLADTYAPDCPALIIPGVYDDVLEQCVAAARPSSTDDRFRVVYFGGLHADYGVAALVDAVPLLDPGIELRLFGPGPLENSIKDAASRHPALVWGGLVDRDRLVNEMASCDLLVNARPARSDLARLSSPSKLIEYAASGRAVMTTRLPSLSPALMAAAFPIDDESPAGIAAAINAAAGMPPDALRARGRLFQAEVRGHYAVPGLSKPLRRLLQGKVEGAIRLRPSQEGA